MILRLLKYYWIFPLFPSTSLFRSPSERRGDDLAPRYNPQYFRRFPAASLSWCGVNHIPRRFRNNPASDPRRARRIPGIEPHPVGALPRRDRADTVLQRQEGGGRRARHRRHVGDRQAGDLDRLRSEEHTSELKSLIRTSYAVFCVYTKNTNTKNS